MVTKNIGMRMQELFFFSWIDRNGTLCVPVFITFERAKISRYFTLRGRQKNLYVKYVIKCKFFTGN